MADWKTCPAVESVPGRLSGARVFKDTRIPVSGLFANLAEGATVEDFLDWFPGVEAWQVKGVLEHEVKHLDSRVGAPPADIVDGRRSAGERESIARGR